MKKILAIALALCLTLSLSVSVFANGSVALPDINHPGPVGPSDSDPNGKLTYNATDANGNPVTIILTPVTSGEKYEAAVPYGIVVMYTVTLVSNTVTGDITIDMYAPGAATSYTVIVCDDWMEHGSVVSVNGNRAKVRVDADTVREYPYVAIVKDFDAVDVDTPQQGIGGEEDPDDGDGDNMNVADPEPEKNPHTGIALAVVPMMVAAAAAVVSKRR